MTVTTLVAIVAVASLLSDRSTTYRLMMSVSSLSVTVSLVSTVAYHKPERVPPCSLVTNIVVGVCAAIVIHSLWEQPRLNHPLSLIVHLSLP